MSSPEAIVNFQFHLETENKNQANPVLYKLNKESNHLLTV